MQEQRKFVRAPVFRNAYVIHKNGRVEHGRMINIAEPGAGIELMDGKKRGQQLQLAFRLPFGSLYEEFIVDVVVSHCHLSHDIYHIGVVFSGLTDSKRKHIKAYIKQKLIKR